MIIIVVIVYSLFGILFDGGLEKGWKGIKVFESNKSDVERVLGKPVEEDSVEARYDTTDAVIRVLYSAGPCVDTETLSGGFKAKAGTVLQYEVNVKKNKLYLKDLNLPFEEYTRHENTHVVGFVEYYNKEHAIRVVTFLRKSGEEVRTIRFYRSEKKRLAFKCD